MALSNPLKTYFSLQDILAVATYYQHFAGKGKKSLLINKALSINPHGGYKNLTFELASRTEVESSCSAQWHNHYYFFGGMQEIRQVSILNGQRLERKATLDFNFQGGACTVLNHQIIVLCFHQYEKDLCHQSNNPLGAFTKLPKSKHRHQGARTASFDGENIIYQKIKTSHFRYTNSRRR